MVDKNNQSNHVEEEPSLPPSIPLFEWQSFGSNLLALLIAFLGVSIAIMGAVKKMNVKLQKVFRLLADESEKQNKHIKKLIESELVNSANKLQVLTNCDRALIFQIHNGDYYKQAQSRDKLSVTAEGLGNNAISPVEGELQDIPKAKLNREFNLLNRFKVLSVDVLAGNIKAGDNIYLLDSGWRNYLTNLGVAYVYDISIVVNAEIIGLVSFHYLENSKDNIKTFDKNYDDIMNLVTRIEAALSGR